MSVGSSDGGRWAGTGARLRFALRRDRILVAAWSATLAVVVAGSVRATTSVYPTAADRVGAARAVDDSPAVRMMYGPIADVHSLGALAVFKLLFLVGLFVALLGAVVVRRHTRTEEESGRADLLAAGVAGPGAGLAAGVLAGSLAVLLAGVVAGGAAAVTGLPATGSLLLAAGWVALGLVAVGLTAVLAQVSASTRTVAGLVAGVLAAAYAVRAVGDVADGWHGLVWLSPFGWVSLTRPYAGDRWWVLLLPVAVTVLALAAAEALRSRRDPGAGLVAPRPGPSHGRISGVLALEVRLARTGLALWTLGLLVLGAVLGAVSTSVGSFVDSPQVRDMLERLGGTGALEDTFLGVEISMVAVAVSAYAVSVVVGAARQEDAGRDALVLAGTVGRPRRLSAALLVSVAGSVVLLTAFGVGAGLGLAVADGRTPVAAVARAVGSTWAQLPAVLLLAALALLLWALSSRLAALAWVLLVAFLVLGQVGELLGLPDWVTTLSPYDHLAALPGESFRVAPAVGLGALATGLCVAAVLRHRSRDLA